MKTKQEALQHEVMAMGQAMYQGAVIQLVFYVVLKRMSQLRGGVVSQRIFTRIG